MPYGSVELNQAATVLHYSNTCFDGKKAFRGNGCKIRLFRPCMNMARFTRSAARVSLPEVDSNALFEIMWKLVRWTNTSYLKTEECVYPHESARLTWYLITGRRTRGIANQRCEHLKGPLVISSTDHDSYIGTTPDIPLAFPKSAFLFVIASPIASYYQAGSRVISMETVAKVAWPRAADKCKVGSNYAPSIVPYMRSKRHGVGQKIWLKGDDNPTTGRQA